VTKRPVVLALVVCLTVWAASGVAQEATGDDAALVRLLQWLEAVQMHTPGDADRAVTEIGNWWQADFPTLIGDIRRLSTFLQRARARGTGPSPTIQVHNRRFSLAEIETIFHGNDTLRSAAVLHADIAMLGGDALRSRGNTAADSSFFVVNDGRGSGVRHESAHWQIGRTVLEGITPSPTSDPGVRLWYRAASSYLLHEGHLGETRVHLDSARRMFPSDPFFLLDSAYLHQNFSSVSLQAAAQDLRATGANPAVESRRMELERAERFFQQTLAVDPGQTDARVRLGHTLGELGRHEESAIELRRAIDARLSGPQLYFAELFLGHEEQALGRLDAAKQHYENAAELYPKAQSPRLALSQLARQSGDRLGALRALKGVTALPPDEGYRWDPWWGYYNPHQDDSARLIDEMRKLARPAIR
jgi:tetratricopeptide (TPR) repeat protein